MTDTDTTSAGTEDGASTTKRSTSPRTSSSRSKSGSSSKKSSSSSSSSGSSKKVWDAIDAITTYVTRHGDEGGNALRAQLADLKPGKTQAVVGEDDPSVSGEDDA